MALFPRIKGACPYKDRLDDLIKDGHCSMCQRDVLDLTAMTDDERMALVCDRKGDVCVRYTVMVPVVAAALGLASGTAMASVDASVGHTPGKPVVEMKRGPAKHRPRPPKLLPPPPIMIPMMTAGVVMPPPPEHPAANTASPPAAALSGDQTSQVEWVELEPGAGSPF